MKRIILFTLLAAGLRLAGLLPFEGRDVAELIPVEAVTVAVEGQEVVVRCGGQLGSGPTWEEALTDLRRGAPGEVFFGTAENLVLSRPAMRVLPDILRSGALRPAAGVCVCPGTMPSPEEAARYLAAHESGVTLGEVEAAVVQARMLGLPGLVRTKGGLRLYGSANG